MQTSIAETIATALERFLILAHHIKHVQSATAAIAQAGDDTLETTLTATIDEFETVFTDANNAIAATLATLSATVDGDITDAIEANASALALASIAIDENNSAITATSQTLDTVSTKVDGEIVAGIQTNAQAITTVDTDGTAAHQALWNVKAQAGDITAGIGLMVDSQSQVSQVVISASQLFVYDPANPVLESIFTISEGAVHIKSAYIQTAFISLLSAETIVADTVVAGISISSPVITGGTITGSELKIGSGGSYGGGYHYYVDPSGNLYAENAVITGTIYADDGYFKGDISGASGTFSGTVTADQILGDLVSAKAYACNQSALSSAWVTISTLQVANNLGLPASVVICGPTFKFITTTGSGTAFGTASFRVLKDEFEIHAESFASTSLYGGITALTLGNTVDSLDAGDTATHTYKVQAKCVFDGGNSGILSLNCISASAVGQIFRAGSAWL